eukprot:scaffold9726_cov119-Isochrysis_galbana.AAC.35
MLTAATARQTSGAQSDESIAAAIRSSTRPKCCSNDERPASEPRYGTLASAKAPITAPPRKSCSRITPAWW